VALGLLVDEVTARLALKGVGALVDSGGKAVLLTLGLLVAGVELNMVDKGAVEALFPNEKEANGLDEDFSVEDSEPKKDA